MSCFDELNKRGFAACFAGLLLATQAGIVLAQGAADNEDSRVALEEIVVTAQLREQRLQDVPLSVTALSEDLLERAGAYDFAEYARMVPGLAFSSAGPGQNRPIIRGISATAGAATVGYYIDETPVTAPIFTGGSQAGNPDPKIFDVNRVEVLRGPQGTLYGASSMGGTIKVVTNQPDTTRFEADTEFTVSSTEHGGLNYQVNAMLNVPVIEDHMAIRVIGFRNDADGFIDRLSASPRGDVPDVADCQGRCYGLSELLEDVLDPNRLNSLVDVEKDVNDESTTGARVLVRIQPSDRLVITPSVFVQESELGSFPFFDDALSAGELQQTRIIDEPTKDRFALYNVTATYTRDSFEVLSSSSWFDREFSAVEDFSLVTEFFLSGIQQGVVVPAPIQRQPSTERFIQELRIRTLNSGRLNAIGGLFYTDVEDKFDASMIIPGYNNIFGTNFPDNLFFFRDDVTDERQAAVFGELTYSFSEALELTFGARWFDVEQTRDRFASGVFNGGPSSDRVEAEEDGVTPKVVLTYRADDNRLIYATAAEGFRIGGGNTVVPSGPCGADLAELGLTAAPSQFDADRTWNYEIGTKSEWLDKRLLLNAAAYYVDWSDVQQNIPLDCGFSFTANAGKAVSQGAELELTLLAWDVLRLSLAVGYTDAQLDVDAPDLGGEKGDRLLNVPEWTGAASIEYLFPAFGVAEGYVRLDHQYVGESYISFDFENEADRRPSYNITNLRIGLDRAPWRGALVVQNLFDTDSVQLIETFGTLVSGFEGQNRRLSTHRPRTIGLMIGRRF